MIFLMDNKKVKSNIICIIFRENYRIDWIESR